MSFILGPVFSYDLLRALRSDRQFVLRMGYACLLSLVFIAGITFGERLAEDLPKVMAYRAARFYYRFFAAQCLAVFFITPVLASGAISEERERGSLTFMLTTNLSDWDIVAGKVFSRFLIIAMILLAGVPILSVSTFLGGVSPDIILSDFLYLMALLLCLTALCVYYSTTCQSSLSAMFHAYGAILAYLAMSPFVCLRNPLVDLFDIRGLPTTWSHLMTLIALVMFLFFSLRRFFAFEPQ